MMAADDLPPIIQPRRRYRPARTDYTPIVRTGGAIAVGTVGAGLAVLLALSFAAAWIFVATLAAIVGTLTAREDRRQ